MIEQYTDNQLELIAWSRIWSPIVPQNEAKKAWQALELPDDLHPNHPAFVGVFITGNPSPIVPMLFHAALGQDGGITREAMVRVMGHLDVRWKDMPMQPDHIAVACEILTLSIQQQEPVLIRELLKRYLFPWCAYALSQVDENDVARNIITRFQQTLYDITL